MAYMLAYQTLLAIVSNIFSVIYTCHLVSKTPIPKKYFVSVSKFFYYAFFSFDSNLDTTKKIIKKTMAKAINSEFEVFDD